MDQPSGKFSVHDDLVAWRRGDMLARDRLFTAFYPDLRLAAAAMLRREQGSSLSTGDLLQEAMARLIRLDRMELVDRSHFLALSSIMMRRVLVDHFRAKRRQKRDHIRATLFTALPDSPPYELLALDEALKALAAIDPERAEIVEMRYFGGMDIADIAGVLSLSESTVKRRWAAARLWLHDAMKDDRS
jgi:RNA polymerase sigma factor (TIGR02999 family)